MSLIGRGQIGVMSEDELIRSHVTPLTECSALLVLALELQHESKMHYNLSADLQLDDRKYCCR